MTSQQKEINTLQESTQKTPPERATIKINDIPTELLERILIKYVQQANNTFKNTQGEIIIPDLSVQKEDNEQLQIPKKRTIAEINENFDNNSIYQDRLNYCNQMLPYYGFEPHEIKKKETRTDEPMSSILKICVAQIMDLSIKNKFKLDNNNNDISINKDTLSLMSDFTAQFFNLFTKRLNRLKEIQRRKLPNRDDLNLLLREGYVDLKGLNEMYYMTHDYNKSNKKWKNNILSEIDQKSHVATLAFNGHDNGMFNKFSDNNDGVIEENSWWIDQIVHRRKRRPYIPDWMPPLPPDYTFKSTPKYSQRITNPIELREKIVQEGRFGEKALDHVLGRENNLICSSISEDESVSSDSENDDINKEEKITFDKNDNINKDNSEENNNEINGEKEPNIIKNDNYNTENDDKVKGKSDVEGKNEETIVDKKNDLVEYAKIRMKILEKRRKEEEERYLSRIESDESKFGRNFGFYTNIKKLPDDINTELNKYRERKFKDLITNLKKQEEMNKKWAMEQEELKKKMDEEKSKYAEANEIHIGSLGNTINNNTNDEFFYDNVDEEVDFDVEFSDMEEVEETSNTENKEISESTESKEINDVNGNDKMTRNEHSLENRKNRKISEPSGEERVLSVRFQDEVETSIIPNDIEEVTDEIKEVKQDLNKIDKVEQDIEDIEDFDEEDFEDVV